MQVDIVCPDKKYAPTYATSLDACMDLKVKVEGGGCQIIKPKQMVLFRTGIQVKVPVDHGMFIFPRSSTGIKLNCRLANSTGVIDAGYRDEVLLAIQNLEDKNVVIDDGQRVAQFVILPRPKIELNFVNDDVNFRENDRNGGIGSSGKF